MKCFYALLVLYRVSLVLTVLFPHQMKATASDNGISSESSKVITILTVVPVVCEQGQGDLKHEQQWKRGEEMLPGALLAVEDINKFSSDMLNGSLLDIIPIKVPSCDLNQGVTPFVKELTMNQRDIFAVIGYFCPNLAQYFSQLIRRMHEDLRVLQISANSLNEESSTSVDCLCPYCTHHSILPSYVVNAKAVVLFLYRLKWNRIALISNNDGTHQTSKQEFIRLATEYGIYVSLKVEMSQHEQVSEQILHELVQAGIKIVVAYISPSEFVDVICNAEFHGVVWPIYAWIFMGKSISEITTNSNLCPHSMLSVSDAARNTLFLDPHLKMKDQQNLKSELTYDTYYESYLRYLQEASQEQNTSLKYNPYAKVLYDSVWAIASALNTSLSIFQEKNISLYDISTRRREILSIVECHLTDVIFQGATGLLNFSQKTASSVEFVKLLQFQRGQLETVGVYDSNIDYFFLNISTSGFPTVTLDRIYILYPVPLTTILTFLISLCFALTSVLMCLFFYHRKQPAIKATSSTLSICMFIGCYFLFTSSMFHTISSGIAKHRSPESIRAFICCLDVYLINIGFDTVFATVVAKTLRIYHIFKKFGKVNRICSDTGLLVLILTIVFIKIAMLTLWTTIDTNHLVDVEQYVVDSVPPYYLVTQQCDATYLNLWIALLFGYSLVLLFALVVLAIMTRKIKRLFFNESKQVSTLTAVLLIHIVISWTLWILFRSIDASVLSKVVYSLNTMLTAVFCQAFLVLPKLILCKKHHSDSKLITKPSQFSMAYRQISRNQIETEVTEV